MLLRSLQTHGFWLASGATADVVKKRQASAALPNRLIQSIIALLVSSVAVADAKDSKVYPQKSAYQIKYWTTEDGLPQHQISCLKQTRDGYLWIGTHFGLSRFD